MKYTGPAATLKLVDEMREFGIKVELKSNIHRHILYINGFNAIYSGDISPINCFLAGLLQGLILTKKPGSAILTVQI